MADDRRVLGLVLLNGGVIVGCAYALAAVAVSLFDDTHPLGRARGIVYLGGLVVVPASLVLLVAGGSVLLRSHSRHSKRRRAKPFR